MTEKRIREILKSVASGKVGADTAFDALKDLPFEDLEFAKLDSHRTMRRGVPEVVFGENKTIDQIAAIGTRVVKTGTTLIITRLAADRARALKRRIPRLKYLPEPRIATLIVEPVKLSGHGSIMVISAGTSDIPVAEEAAICAELFGNRVTRLYDVGVAGLHRLTANLESIKAASALIVVAGMEGALPSVVAGLLDKPVVAVPTSVGYGTAFGRIAELL